MPHDRIEALLRAEIAALATSGRLKGKETVVAGIVPAADGKGPRYLIEGEGDRPFIRMNSNGYLGLSTIKAVRETEESAVGRFGTGPGAVRFIGGTWSPHVALERRLAAFHGREAAMAYSSAYAAVMGVLLPLIDPETAVISDALNHNSIINAVRLAQPREKRVYRHLDPDHLEQELKAAARQCRRAIVVTDGVFSMRGDHAPLGDIVGLAKSYDSAFAENVLVVVDDSHGVGAFGATGRGTEEFTASGPVDVLIGTLGKAFGVNGGYVATTRTIVDYLRETSPFYIYSNPIAPGEAAAAGKSIDIVDGPEGKRLLGHLGAMKRRFEDGLTRLGLETIAGSHPITPLMVRDTAKTAAVVDHLRRNGVLATGLNFPVVPKGDQEIRFQISADHTPLDIDETLAILADLPPSARA